MNGIEPKPHESGVDFSHWEHHDLCWFNAIEVADCADAGWGVRFWQVVTSGGITKKRQTKQHKSCTT